MKRSLAVGAVLVAALGIAPLAHAQPYPLYPPPFQIRPAMPESMPTVSPYAGLIDDPSGTARPTIAATPDCGAANPQGGIPSPVTGTCP
ncbi:MAG TPA: hypothetical protein VG308_18660 [Stellaceae bacterium]|jgi:hypothetical protein|nr:hypothetical protein [Stellaceae bacterium]